MTTKIRGNVEGQRITLTLGSGLTTTGDTITASGSGAAWGTISGTLADQTDLNTALSGKSATSHNHDSAYAAASHTHAASAISDSTAAGRSMITAADAAAQTALLSSFAGSAKGLVPVSVGGTSNFLRADGSWAAPAGGSSPTGVLDDRQFSVLQSDGTLNAASGVQTWAGTNKTGQDVFTVAANSTYLVEGQYILNTGATTHTTAMAWALSGATVADFQYQVLLWSAALNTLTTTQTTVHVSGVASKVLNATSTAVYTNIQFKGILVTGTGGTITPQINFSANPTGTNLMKRGSWTSFTKLGADTVTTAGGWA